MRTRTWLGLAVVATGFYYVHHRGGDNEATARPAAGSADEPLTETLQALNRPIGVPRPAPPRPELADDERPRLPDEPTAGAEGTLRGTAQPNAAVYIHCDATLTSGGTVADATGHYEIPHLAPGTYDIELTHDDSQVIEHQQIVVEADIVIDKNYIRSIPVPGRTFEAVLGVAAGTQSDPPGDLEVSFSGAGITENEIYIDGPVPQRFEGKVAPVAPGEPEHTDDVDQGGM